MDYQSLFTPFNYKTLSLKNRIVMPAMTRKRSPYGIPTSDVKDYYTRRATDSGLIISEGTVVERPASKNFRDIPNFYGAALNSWSDIINSVHQQGGAMAPQLWHVGITKPDPSGWLPPAPMEGPATMGLEDIQGVIQSFAMAAVHAKNLGFDSIELHGAHGYLIDQFFWEKSNQRTDEYGGSTLKERTRFAVDIIHAIREAVGPDLVIIMRLSQWKIQDYDARLTLTPQEMDAWLVPMAEAGVDIFHCSQRRYWEPEFEGSDLNFAGWAKKITGKPTITVGSIGLSGEFLQTLYHGDGSERTDFTELIRRFDRGDFDLVAVGRSILQDPEWIKKIKEGRLHDIKDFSQDSLKSLY